MTFDPTFRATGKGLAVSNAARKADQWSGNLRLINLGVPVGDPYREHWLYCNGVSEQWNISGTSSQAVNDSTWFARSSARGPLVLSCQWPSQDAYDRFVEFIQVHHKTAIWPGKPSFDSNVSKPVRGGHGLRVTLLRGEYPTRDKDGRLTQYGDGFIVHRGIDVGGYIPSVKAGHKQGVFAPEASFEVHVTDDREQKAITTSAMMNAQISGAFLKQIMPDGYVSEPEETEQDFAGSQRGVIDTARNAVGAIIDVGTDVVDTFIDLLTGDIKK